MKKIGDLSLGSKITLGFVIVLILMLLSTLLGYIGFKNSSNDYNLYQDMSNLNVTSSKIQASLLNSRIQFKNYTITGDEKYILEFNKHFSEMNDLIYHAKNSIEDPSRKEKIQQIYQYALEYKTNVDNVVEYNRKRNEITDSILSIRGQKIQNNLSLIMNTSKDSNISIIASKTQEYLLAARLHAVKYVLHDNKVEIDSFKTNYKEFDKWLSELNDSIRNTDKIDVVNTINLDSKTYYDSFINLISITDRRNNLSDNLDVLGPQISSVAEEIKQSITTEQEAFGPKVQEANNRMLSLMLAISMIAVLLSIIVAIKIKNLVLEPVKAITNTFIDISREEVDLKLRLSVKSEDEMGQLALWFNNFMNKLQLMMNEKEQLAWIRTAKTELNDKMRGEQEISTLSDKIIGYICNLIESKVGALYIVDENKNIRLMGRYSWINDISFRGNFKSGEGLVGQVVLDRKYRFISNIPEDYMKISSGIGEATPNNIIIVPCIYNNEVKCVVELGTFENFQDIHLQFIKQVSENIAIAINSQQTRTKLETLLRKSIEMSEELQAQQEELRVTNEELEDRTKSLEKQKEEIEEKNISLAKANEEIEKKAKQLEVSNKYKSEFLANVSHELKTPLNSILILSQILSEKKDLEPLTQKQREFANTINSSGKDLLLLINDILDLSKVEAGKLDVYVEDVHISELVKHIEDMFIPIAESKKLKFYVQVENNVPKSINTDDQRIKQILRNILSNAFKFTETGEVSVKIAYPMKDTIFRNRDLKIESTIGIFISDTGIGIPKDKQKIIFEAFKQVDGTTSRKYGGSGLGLSISKELAELLGGEIQLISEEGKGSTFVLYLPEKFESKDKEIIKNEEIVLSEQDTIGNILKKEPDKMEKEIQPKPIGSIKKENLLMGKKILIVDDDMRNVFALTNFMEKNGVEVTAAKNGREGIEKLNKNIDINLVIMDVMMPEMNGYEAIMEIRKIDKFKKIPIIALTAKAMKEDRKKCIDAGASDYMVKPVDYEKLLSLLRVWLY